MTTPLIAVAVKTSTRLKPASLRPSPNRSRCLPIASHIGHNGNGLISTLAPPHRDGYLFQIGEPQGVLYDLDRPPPLWGRAPAGFAGATSVVHRLKWARTGAGRPPGGASRVSRLLYRETSANGRVRINSIISWANEEAWLICPPYRTFCRAVGNRPTIARTATEIMAAASRTSGRLRPFCRRMWLIGRLPCMPELARTGMPPRHRCRHYLSR